MVLDNLPPMESILKQFDPPTLNNSREIVKSLLLRFKRNPSEMLAQKLEAYGIAVDFLDGDLEASPRGGK